ncbi:probable F-box protein At2g36090 [Prosopis cineraria]|uniref:probable F-box protein At2g36090 n=1 Tax=Prosopis cineraria TaxID=364024 RepID=UPI0024109B10|nr:probable F-box protein At2g36090 [Prosopis cineraria]
MASSSDAPLTTLHPDLFHAHVLSRLDGPSLASASSASSLFRNLCLHDPLWRHICNSTWPSLSDPTLRPVISNFPAGHRSLFLDSFPVLHHCSRPDHLDRSFAPAKEWISAVDIYYHDKPIFSRVHRTQTHTGWFECSPLWIDLLGPKESVPTPLKYARKDEDWMKHLEDTLSLSWILIDPARNRAGNLSSRRPVSAQRHWLTGELELFYAAVIACDEGPSEWVQCNIKVACTCSEEVGGAMRVREVSLTVEDTDGRSLNGKQSMVILQRAVERGRRKMVNEEEAKARFEEFSSIKRDRRDKRERSDQTLDMVLIFAVITIFAFLFWCFFS